MKALLIALLAILAFGSVPATADVPNHEVPTWMRQDCTHSRTVNCHAGHDANERYIREMPGTRHMVCVFYVTRPKRDYCA